jgi:hypothetical protein
MPGDHHTPWILAGEKETLVDFPAGFLVSPFSGCPMRLLSAFQPICASTSRRRMTFPIAFLPHTGRGSRSIRSSWRGLAWACARDAEMRRTW